MRKKICVKFKHLVVIGPKFGRKNIKGINNKQVGWLEISYLSNRIRIVEVIKTLYLF